MFGPIRLCQPTSKHPQGLQTIPMARAREGGNLPCHEKWQKRPIVGEVATTVATKQQ